MTTAGIALITALGALVLAVAVAALARLPRHGSRDEVSQGLVEVGRRLDELTEQLAQALQRVRQDSTRAQALLDLAHAGDLDEVLARAVDAASHVAGVDVALVRVEAPDGTASVAARGIPAELARAHLVSGPPDGRPARAVHLAYRYGDEDEPPGALRTGVVLPIAHAGAPLGFVAAYSFDLHVDEDELVASLAAIARAAGPALHATLRGLTPAVASATGAVDSLTGLRNRTGFHEALAAELARSHRLGRPLALLLLDIDGFKRLNAEIGHLAGDEVIRSTAAHIRECLRDDDVACRIGGDEFAVVLPGSGRDEAESAFARIQAAQRRQPREATASVTLSGGVATARLDDHVLTLLQRAEEALRRAKAAGRGSAA